ncbi:MAG: hypothetical protein CMI26_00680 [Opitutae bacterium]|nr:hypothetical protein [Opitutae bacterium]|tara:strand:- start:422 stop:706 length:285 start_codon:yes stop_codon:yes gene_type:complete
MSEENSSLKSNESDPGEYWKANLKLMGWLLVVWFVVSYGCGILFVDELNSISLGGFKLGFWFAQQGAIYVFVALIFVYVKKMNKLDREFGVEEE